MEVSINRGAGVARFSAITGGAALVLSFAFGGQALAAITASKHDLSPTGTGANKFTATDVTQREICVFCHTPHGADSTASVPLWNRKLAAGTYTTYNTLGTSSLIGGVAKVGSVSIACLSCHDGATAMDVMINAPGSGGYNPAGAAWSLTGGSWTTGTGQLNGATITNIGANLTNDHPVGIQYAGGPKTTAPTTGVYAAANFRNPDFVPAYGAAINGSTVWWVDTAPGTATVRDKTDMQLYSRNPTTDVGNGTDGSLIAAFGTVGVNANQPFVECASCHDPHGPAGTTQFLRLSNQGSAVCLACHVK
ncbi:MAG: hypothetical protein QG662_1058 [Pseudomonadota bacterium]|nr:hypothetical protein [Pseudomonadota bacterium]